MTYRKDPGNYLALSDKMITKLKLITVADMGQKRRATLIQKTGGALKSTLGYDELKKALDINDIRQLEDLLIEAMFTGLINGKLDQKNKMLHVHSTFGRDVRDENQINLLVKKLMAWD